MKKIRPLTFIYVFVTETLAVFACSLLYLFKSKKLDKLGKNPENKPHILCVHGYLHNESAWFYFRRRLRYFGVGTINTVFYPSWLYDIPQNSLRIKKRIEQIRKETKQEVKVLIGHSLGGLECLEYALEHAPKDELIYIITLGSPLHGSKMAFTGFGPSSRQMEVGSSYLKSLHQRLEKATHIRVLTLASKTDPLVIPNNSALIQKIPYIQWEEFDALGHVSFLFSKRIRQRIVTYFRNQGMI